MTLDHFGAKMSCDICGKLRRLSDHGDICESLADPHDV